MDVVLLFIVLAITVEALVEYGRTIIEHENKQALVLQVVALAVGVALCSLAGADVYSFLGVSFGNAPLVGCILTGVFASRGANYASDILGKLQNN